MPGGIFSGAGPFTLSALWLTSIWTTDGATAFTTGEKLAGPA